MVSVNAEIKNRHNPNLRGLTMSDAVDRLEAQLKEIKQGLFLMGPNRERAMSTHETEDLIVKLESVADEALENLDSLKR